MPAASLATHNGSYSEEYNQYKVLSEMDPGKYPSRRFLEFRHWYESQSSDRRKEMRTDYQAIAANIEEIGITVPSEANNCRIVYDR